MKTGVPLRRLYASGRHFAAYLAYEARRICPAFAILISGVTLLFYCESLRGDAPSSEALTNIQTFKVKGVVKQLRSEEKTVLVAHEAIPNYMDAMTMPFIVREPAALTELQGGDQIAFELHVTETQSWIDHISKLGRSAMDESKPVS